MKLLTFYSCLLAVLFQVTSASSYDKPKPRSLKVKVFADRPGKGGMPLHGMTGEKQVEPREYGGADKDNKSSIVAMPKWYLRERCRIGGEDEEDKCSPPVPSTENYLPPLGTDCRILKKLTWTIYRNGSFIPIGTYEYVSEGEMVGDKCLVYRTVVLPTKSPSDKQQ